MEGVTHNSLSVGTVFSGSRTVRLSDESNPDSCPFVLVFIPLASFCVLSISHSSKKNPIEAGLCWEWNVISLAQARPAVPTLPESAWQTILFCYAVTQAGQNAEGAERGRQDVWLQAEAEGKLSQM